jgi:hypothetical protein
MPLQTTATPLNGREVATMLKNQSNHLIDQTPMLDEASSFHRCTIEGEFKLTAYPADVPTPKKEFAFNVDSISTKRAENEEVFNYVKKLETNREELLHLLQQIDEQLEIYAPQMKIRLNNGEALENIRRTNSLWEEDSLEGEEIEKVYGR